MRNIFIVLFLFGSFTGFTQTYKPLVKEGATWIIETLTDEGIFVNSYYFLGDTNSNGHSYKKLYHSEQDSSLLPSSSDRLHSLWREDSLKRVYVYPILKIVGLNHRTEFGHSCQIYDTVGSDYLIYDFGMNVGDTIYQKGMLFYDSAFYKVENITKYNLSGVEVKKFDTRRQLSHELDTWYEGIGSSSGLFFPLCEGGVELIWRIGCYYDDSIYFRDNNLYSCQYLHYQSIEHSALRTFKLFPNPTYRDFTIDFDREHHEIEMVIKDIRGRTILKSSYQNTNSINAEIKGKPGIYLVQLRAENEYLGTFKIVKQ